MRQDELCDLTLTAVGALVKSREISPVEVLTALLHRIDQLDGRLKSYALVMEDEAKAAAATAEREIQAGGYRGPLHGVPVAVKDLFNTRGVRTMGGTPVLRGNVPDHDAEVVTRLKSAGAIVVGKLNMTEGAMVGYARGFDVPVNPWNAEYWSGASSSGPGVATSAGLCFGALGSDTGGSIRFPSAANGIVGLKPTWGRVSRYGALALAESMDHVGPMTRSTADAAVMLQSIAGVDRNDPTTLIDPVGNYLQDIDKAIEGVRIGVDDYYIRNGTDPELADAVVAAITVLEDLGANLVEVEMPDLDEYLAGFATLCSAEAAEAHSANYPSRRDEYGLFFRDWLDMGTKVSGAGYARANHLRAACIGKVRLAFEKIDVLACPSTPAPPHKVTPEMMYGGMSDGLAIDPGLLVFTAVYNYNGAPTLSLPCGFNSDGLPLSLQIVGRHLGEQLMCRVGHAYEQATQWHTMHPVM